jgi:hypothetical protein
VHFHANLFSKNYVLFLFDPGTAMDPVVISVLFAVPVGAWFEFSPSALWSASVQRICAWPFEIADLAAYVIIEPSPHPG